MTLSQIAELIIRELRDEAGRTDRVSNFRALFS